MAVCRDTVEDPLPPSSRIFRAIIEDDVTVEQDSADASLPSNQAWCDRPLPSIPDEMLLTMRSKHDKVELLQHVSECLRTQAEDLLPLQELPSQLQGTVYKRLQESDASFAKVLFHLEKIIVVLELAMLRPHTVPAPLACGIVGEATLRARFGVNFTTHQLSSSILMKLQDVLEKARETYTAANIFRGFIQDLQKTVEGCACEISSILKECQGLCRGVAFVIDAASTAQLRRKLGLESFLKCVEKLSNFPMELTFESAEFGTVSMQIAVINSFVDSAIKGVQEAFRLPFPCSFGQPVLVGESPPLRKRLLKELDALQDLVPEAQAEVVSGFRRAVEALQTLQVENLKQKVVLYCSKATDYLDLIDATLSEELGCTGISMQGQSGPGVFAKPTKRPIEPGSAEPPIRCHEEMQLVPMPRKREMLEEPESVEKSPVSEDSQASKPKLESLPDMKCNDIDANVVGDDIEMTTNDDDNETNDTMMTNGPDEATDDDDDDNNIKWCNDNDDNEMTTKLGSSSNDNDAKVHALVQATEYHPAVFTELPPDNTSSIGPASAGEATDDAESASVYCASPVEKSASAEKVELQIGKLVGSDTSTDTCSPGSGVESDAFSPKLIEDQISALVLHEVSRTLSPKKKEPQSSMYEVAHAPDFIQVPQATNSFGEAPPTEMQEQIQCEILALQQQIQHEILALEAAKSGPPGLSAGIALTDSLKYSRSLDNKQIDHVQMEVFQYNANFHDADNTNFRDAEEESLGSCPKGEGL